MPTDLHVNILRAAIEEGRSLESGLAELCAMGVTSREAMRAIHSSQLVSLAEAKKILAASHVWVPKDAPRSAAQRAALCVGLAVLVVAVFPVAQAIRKNFDGLERAAAYLLLFSSAYVFGKVVLPWLARRFGFGVKSKGGTYDA